MTFRLSSLFLAAAVVGLAATPASAQVFVFSLSGDEEVPPTPTTLTGGCRGVLDQPGATFDIVCSHDVVGATMIHIHRGAAGVNGPVVFDLGDPASPVAATWTGMTPADIADLLAGDLYLNIHTAGRPDGVIRGQVLPSFDMLAFGMDGAQAVPPNGTAATGSCTLDLDAAATAMSVSCTHDLADPAAAHVHRAPRGQNGPEIFTFASPASPFGGSVPLAPVEVADLAAGFLYVDVHGTAVPGEEPATPQIRGQIAEPVVAPTTGTLHIRKLTFPAGGTGFGFTDDVPGSPGSFTLDDGQTETFLSVPAGTYTFTEDDPGTAPGGFVLTHVECSDADSAGDRFTRTATVVLAAGETVSCTFENQELASGDPFVFHLDATQEVPPLSGPERGGCMALFDSVAAELTLVCVHDVVGPTIMHIHRAAAGANGPIVFDLGDPISPVLATWSGMTPADVADLLAGNLYVNIHTSGRPEGAIRGQIVERSFDSLAFAMNGAQAVPPNGTVATGSCIADLDDPAAAVAIQCSHDLPLPQAAHLHQAPRGQNGPTLFTFPSPATPFSDTVPLAPIDVANLVAGFLYVDVHGPPVPGSESAADEIRGQIAEPPVAPTTGTIHVQKRTFPAGGTGFGFTDDVPGSPGVFTLDDGQTETFLAVPPGTYTFTEDDPGAAPGGHVLTDVECSDTDSVGDRFARTATVQLAAGESVTCTFENQALASGQPFAFHLSPDQEVPPLSGSERGGCMASFDGVDELTLVCTHDVVGPTIMHIHRAPAGANGPIVFDLGNPASPVLATWSGMTPADVADLLAGNLYVNIHTSGRPTGAIRGQIVPRSIEGWSFPLSGQQQVPPVVTSASGHCTASLDASATELTVECAHDVVSPTMAHVHQAPAGANGPIRFALADPSSPFTLVTPMTPRDVADLMAGFFYVNVHSEANPDGEIRGQIVNQPATVTDIPALGGWGALLFALALAGLAARRLLAG